MKIIGKEFEYEVVDGCIGQTDTFTLYECKLPDDKPGILKIAKEVENNGILDREALILGTLLETALKVEKNDAEKGGEKSKLGYQCFFPKLVEYFVSSDQGGRCVLILDFSEVAKKLTDLVPLDHIMSREQKRIDPKTSAWIMGRLLKLLHFANWLGISVTINGDNILINPERHKVVIFDWSKSTIVQGPVQKDISREEISSAAKEVITTLGGNIESGEIPASDQLTSSWYKDFLWSLACGEYCDAGKAHTAFYKLIQSNWPSKFHPFTVHAVR